MRYAYWVAFVAGILIAAHAVLAGAWATWFRLTVGLSPIECRPEGWVGFACGGPSASPGFLLEATLVIRLVIGLLLIWAFLRHLRETA